MEIMDGRVATIHYTLTDDDGVVIDRSTPEAPLSYLHGAGNIVPGLEQALTGKQQGDTVQADVPPEKAYGPRHEQLVQQVAKTAFPEGASVVPGMQFEARSERGPMVVRSPRSAKIRSRSTATIPWPAATCTSPWKWPMCVNPPPKSSTRAISALRRNAFFIDGRSSVDDTRRKADAMRRPFLPAASQARVIYSDSLQIAAIPAKCVPCHI